ncbi:Hypothetical_protein [Hexamita inflata]|uniref:Hypothetical_protein n=1 Tax=Hexamita inflata TaxID=28002 RepID=A0AA86N6F2_9EUKA|nr:Hypothetical protein HINF_LOCUS1512 [Hexamita inflata]
MKLTNCNHRSTPSAPRRSPRFFRQLFQIFVRVQVGRTPYSARYDHRFVFHLADVLGFIQRYVAVEVQSKVHWLARLIAHFGSGGNVQKQLQRAIIYVTGNWDKQDTRQNWFKMKPYVQDPCRIGSHIIIVFANMQLLVILIFLILNISYFMTLSECLNIICYALDCFGFGSLVLCLK